MDLLECPNDEEKRKGCLRDYALGWTVCVASVLLNLFRTMPSYCFGVFIPEFEHHYKRPMMELDWIGVMSICLTDFFSPIPTMIIRKVGMKGYSICAFSGTVLLTISCIASSFVEHIPVLFFTFSLLNGMGSAMILMASTLIVNEYFPFEHRFHVFATSLFQCSYPITILAFTPLYAWIIKITSWKIGFLVQGVMIVVAGTFCSLVYFPLKQPMRQEDGEIDVCELDMQPLKDNKQQDIKKSKWWDVFKTPERVCWQSGIMLTVACNLMPVMNLPHYMKKKGFEEVASSVALVILGVSEIIFYCTIVGFGDRFKGKLVYLNIVSCFIMALLMLLWPVIDPSYNVVLFLSFILGLVATLSFVFCYPTSKEAMNMEMDIAWTATCVAMGFGSLINPIISGLIYDYRHDYNDVFYIVGGVSILNGLNFALIPMIQRWKRRKCYDRLE